MMVSYKQDWGKFTFGKNFLERESPTLRSTSRPFCSFDFANRKHWMSYFFSMEDIHYLVWSTYHTVFYHFLSKKLS